MTDLSSHDTSVGPTRFYRPAYEGIAAVLWLGGSLVLVAIARTTDAGYTIICYTALPMFVFGAFRFSQLLQNWMMKTRLTLPLPFWTTEEAVFAKQRKHDQTFVGRGFTWEPIHAGRIKEISSMARLAPLQPPAFFAALLVKLGLAVESRDSEGKQYFHGVESTERDIFVAYEAQRSHTLLLGTNGAGKTRMLELLVAQAIARQESAPPLNDGTVVDDSPRKEFGPVFILDPKGDNDLRDRAYATAKQFGREKDFFNFCPSFKNESIRLNPLATYERTTEIASRVASLLPSGGEAESFKAFAWRAINVVVEAMDFCRITVDLTNLRRYVEGGIAPLIVTAIDQHLKAHASVFSEYHTDITRDSGRVAVPDGHKAESIDTLRQASARAAYYTTKVRATHPHQTIDGLIAVLNHDPTHYNKLISNLIPMLMQLTSDPMRILLSEAPEIHDARKPTNFLSLMQRKAIVYINFESLKDSAVGSALGSLFIADLTACAAKRHQIGQSFPPVSIFVDEAAEMMNEPFIQALNKGRSAGFEITLASQTIADFTARLGDRAKAQQTLGNVNTTIAMRLHDEDSIDMVTTKFSESTYQEKTTGKAATTIAPMAKRGRDFSGSVTKNAQASDLSLVSGDMLTSLPRGHYFAHLPGGEKVKGRVLLMPLKDEDRFRPMVNGMRPDHYCLKARVPSGNFRGGEQGLDRSGLHRKYDDAKNDIHAGKLTTPQTSTSTSTPQASVGAT